MLIDKAVDGATVERRRSPHVVRFVCEANTSTLELDLVALRSGLAPCLYTHTP